jgi:hypothetical protein
MAVPLPAPQTSTLGPGYISEHMDENMDGLNSLVTAIYPSLPFCFWLCGRDIKSALRVLLLSSQQFTSVLRKPKLLRVWLQKPRLPK